MPFSLFCVGNDNFHGGGSRIPVLGDVYDIQTAMGRLTTAGTDGIGAAVRGVVSDAVDDARADAEAAADDYTERTMRAYDRISGLYMFRQGVGFACGQMTPMRITLHARNEGLILSDSAFASVTLYADDVDPAESLLHAIHPALVATELNCAGVLGHIGRVLSEFSAWPCLPFGNDSPARYMLNISVARL